MYANPQHSGSRFSFRTEEIVCAPLLQQNDSVATIVIKLSLSATLINNRISRSLLNPLGYIEIEVDCIDILVLICSDNGNRRSLRELLSSLPIETQYAIHQHHCATRLSSLLLGINDRQSSTGISSGIPPLSSGSGARRFR